MRSGLLKGSHNTNKAKGKLSDLLGSGLLENKHDRSKSAGMLSDLSLSLFSSSPCLSFSPSPSILFPTIHYTLLLLLFLSVSHFYLPRSVFLSHIYAPSISLRGNRTPDQRCEVPRSYQPRPEFNIRIQSRQYQSARFMQRKPATTLCRKYPPES